MVFNHRAELRHALAQLGGRALAGVKLSRVTRVAAGGHIFYLKRRRWYAPYLIAGAVALPAAHFSVLSERAWLAWEPAIYRRVYGRHVQIDGARQLRLPELPGVVLAELLRDADRPVETRLRALAAAAGALRQLHGLWVRFPDASVARFSHADATAHNVIYDLAGGAARWFDFETVHDRRRPEAWRHADDLRTLAYSAAACLDERDLFLAAQAIVAAYADRPALLALREMAVSTPPDMFQLAQADIGYHKGLAWTEALATVLREKGV